MNRLRTLAAALALLTMTPAASLADDLTIGMRVETVMDPHYFWGDNYVQYYRHYLGFLTVLDKDAKLTPSLAEKWEASATGWTFHLRPNVKFSDGSAFDAEDVVASFKRARDYPNAVGSYAGLFKDVTDMKATDPLTFTVETKAAAPTLGFAFSQVPIIPSEVAATATQTDFNTTKGSVSIGPYKFVSFTAGQEMVLERNPDYWGEKPKWDKVTLRFLPDPAARTAALLAGDVDVIGSVPPEFVERIRADDRFAIHTGPSMRTMYVSMDKAADDKTAFAFANDGTPLKVNPFKDKRVREAMSLAIDRDIIRDKVMLGLSFPTGQLIAPGLGGHSDSIKVPAADPAKAKALLAEAGYPDGFKTQINCTNDRYVNDAKICQVLGQMFSRVGIKTEVVTMPSAAFFKFVNQRPSGASIMLMSWSPSGSGEADVLSQTLQTFDAEKRTGSWNYHGYSNPEFDAMVDSYSDVIDDTERRALEAKAAQFAVDDYASIPLHDQSVVVATRKDLNYTTNLSDLTEAMSVR
jgi:peptide/nickel transport system substrate-binding protein